VAYLLLVNIISALGLLLIYWTFAVDLKLPIGWLLLLICGSLLFNTINQTSIPLLNMLGENKGFILLSIASLVASLTCASFLVLVVKPEAQYWLLGLLIGQALFGIIGTQVLFLKLGANKPLRLLPTISRQHLKQLINFSWPVSIAAGLAWVQLQGYRYLMDGELGLSQLGLFIAGYGISAGVMAAFESVLTTFFQPRLYRDTSVADVSQQAKVWQRYATAVIPSLILTAALSIVLAPELTQLLLGKEFQSSSIFIIWGALAEVSRVLVGIYSLIAHIHMRTHWLIIPNVIGGALSIMLITLLIPAMGAEGVGLGLVLSGITVVVIMHICLVSRVCGGISIRPIFMAGIFSMALWVLAISLRYLLDSTGWLEFICVCAAVGSLYLALQYLFLHSHLRDKFLI
jgi:O-antigen/teichoic acid export membrane protein